MKTEKITQNETRNKLNKSAKFLIASDLIYSLTALFIETFLVAYFLKITNESIVQISIYYILIYFILGIGNVLIGRAVKVKQESRTKIMSIGIVLRALFILGIVLLKEKIAENFVIIAIIYGISEVFYWVAHEVVYIDVTTNENRKHYMSIKKILGKILNIVAPIILGSSIELYSFTKIAIYVFILSVVQIMISLQIHTEKRTNTEVEKFSIKEFIKKLNKEQREKIDKYTKSAIAYGVIESSIQTLVVVITIMTFKTSFNLGILTSIFSVFSMITLYLYKKFYNKKNSKYVLFVSSTLIVVGVIGLIADINKISLTIYNCIYTIAICILGVIYDTKKGDLVKECNIERWKVEFVSYVGLFISSGRILGYIMMFVTGIINNILVFKTLLGIVSIVAPVYGYLMYKVEKE